MPSAAACDEKPAFYTVPEAATILRVSKNTLYRAIREGAFEHTKIGETIRIPARVIDEKLKGAAA